MSALPYIPFSVFVLVYNTRSLNFSIFQLLSLSFFSISTQEKMDNAVFETLLGVANSDGSIRTAAENRLKELAVQPGKSQVNAK